MLGLELQAWGLLTLIDVADELLGADRVDNLFADWDVDVRNLVTSRAWITFAFGERVMAAIAETCGEEALSRAGWRAMSPRYLGPLFPLVRAVANPSSTMEQIARAAPRFNKARTVTVEWIAPCHAKIRFALVPGVDPPTTTHFCSIARAQIEAVPVLFGQAAARVVSETCMAAGDKECVFEAVWEERRRTLPLWLAGVLGAVAGGGLTIVFGGSGVGVAGVGALAAAAGFFALYSKRLQDEVSVRMDSVAEYRDALSSSVRENEDRFRELVAAKDEVEVRVVERTAELQETSRKLGQTLAEVRALDQAKSDFFANLSHELRTPLTMILSPLGSLVRGEDPPGGLKATIAAMQANASRLLHLINQLLDLAKFDAGKVEITRTGVTIGPFVEKLVKSYQPAVTASGKRIRCEFATSATMTIDVRWLETALTNLIANALRYAEAEIVVRVRDEGGEVTFEVEDDGPGLANDELERVFQRFGQAAGTSGGTGLGLALAKEAARLHDGTLIAVRRDEGERRGALFRMVLPRTMLGNAAGLSEVPPASTKVHLSATSTALLEAARDDESSERKWLTAGEGAPRAMVVEDHPELRTFIAEILASRFLVTAFSSPPLALERIDDIRPDIIVSDVSMPQMDGLEFCRRVRAMQRYRDTPLLLVTARTESAHVLEGFDAGADDYIPKPFHGRELLARVDVHMRLREMGHRLAHQERLATLGVLAASVAHQIRNPLSAIRSGLPAVERKFGDSLDERTARMFAMFQDCIGNIDRTTVDLLDLSRLDRASEGEFAPGAGLMSAVRLMSTQMADNVDVFTDVDEAPVIMGRAGDLNHVFLNVLENAARAIGGGGRVRISGKIERGNYVIHFEDNGPGVPEALRSKVFDAFVTTTQQDGGTGLGLSIAREIVHQHDGTISVDESPTLGGARFIVTLPLPKASSTAKAAARPSVPAE